MNRANFKEAIGLHDRLTRLETKRAYIAEGLAISDFELPQSLPPHVHNVIKHLVIAALDEEIKEVAAKLEAL